MKKNFESIPGCHLLPPTGPYLVHCTRCGQEYLHTKLVFGRRDGDVESGIKGWMWYCADDTCYGKQPQDIYTVTVESA